MQFAYDPGSGLLLPPIERERAGPNPRSVPAVEAVYERELAAIAFRLGRKLRFRFSSEMGVWFIQQQKANGDWQDVFINSDQETAWSGNQWPYRPVDRRCLEEFCKSSLQLRQGSGDFDRDRAAMDRAARERAEHDEDTKHRRGVEDIANMVSGGDPRRFGKLLRHEQVHAQQDQDIRNRNNYVRFQDIFQVHRDTPVEKGEP